MKAPSAALSRANVSLGTSIGVSREENQDRTLFLISQSSDPAWRFALGVLCDGIGGMAKGEEAAVLALTTFAARILRTTRLRPEPRLKHAAIDANNAVFSRYSGSSGATLSAVLVTQNGPPVGVNVGDSRIYGITPDRNLRQLSKDDTLAGYLGQERAVEDHHARLVQYVGMGEGVEPHIINIDTREHSHILLTSDGVHWVPRDAMERAVSVADDPSKLVRKLLTLTSVLGGRDNGTALSMKSSPWWARDNQNAELNLICLSPVNQLEIWSPRAFDQDNAPKEERDDKSRPFAPAPDDGANTLAAEEPANRKPKKAKKKRVGGQPSLPLDDSKPEVDIVFPKRDGR
ncbi:PP2C family protein-serine/threonine phosphatase [Mesorhizobium australicum]|uniref:PP2C family protein-serine/threonine phosphatase n=1 Tax=Mesorhizobium australicum TaxID=536018 RepID=UPI003337521C